MVFTSTIFIFYFLPLFGCIYGLTLLTRRRSGRGRMGENPPLRAASSFWAANAALLLFSLLFYYWGEDNAIVVLLDVIAMNYLFAFRLAPGRENSRRTWIIVAVGANILVLVVFKYTGFLVSLVAGATGLAIPIPAISLPLGISFFIFQAMSYVIDVHRGTVAPNRSLVNFACYISMFPQLVAGPIVRYADIARQLDERRVGLARFSGGVERFIIGLAKKVLIANNVALFVDVVFAMRTERLTPSIAWVAMLCYAVQIYFDFSGYSDMAIGMGKMLGFDFKENFRHPYAAVSMQDFWRRWHISLSTWFRDYLYIPLGGNRLGRKRTYLNLAIVFVLCGLWHGAAVNFVLWGAYHGAFLIFERATGIDFSRRPLLGRVYTLVAVIFGWVLFRAEGADQIAAFAGRMLFLPHSTAGAGGEYAWLWFTLDIRFALLCGLIFSFPVYKSVSMWLATRAAASRPALRSLVNGAGPWCRAALLLTLLLACIPFLVGESYNPFIYFRF